MNNTMNWQAFQENPSIIQEKYHERLRTVAQFKITIESVKRYGNYENKARHAVALFAKVFNMPQFKDKVLHFTWDDDLTFADSSGLTNPQVFNKLISGPEIANTGLSYHAHINLRVYGKILPFLYPILFTSPDNNLINTKWDFIKSSTLPELAGHYAHEYCHCLGFEHDFDETDRRAFSVPYSIGNIVTMLSKKYCLMV